MNYHLIEREKDGTWSWDGPVTLEQALSKAVNQSRPWGPEAAIVQVHIDGTITIYTIAEAQEEASQ